VNTSSDDITKATEELNLILIEKE